MDGTISSTTRYDRRVRGGSRDFRSQGWSAVRSRAMRLALLVSCVLGALATGCSDSPPTGVVVAPRDSTANYTVTFQSTWSAATHPQAFPGNAHFSGLIGATHTNAVVFWNEGQLASPGIQAMAELGSKSPMTDEVAAAIAAGAARFELSGGGIGLSPGTVSLDFTISDSHPLVTLVSMIAPSPDWFVGVAGLPLLQNDQWVDSLVVTLKGFDAGTDDGATYAAVNAPSTPHVPIARLETGPFEVGGQVPSLGTYTFVRRR